MSARANAVLSAILAFGFMGSGCDVFDETVAELQEPTAYTASDSNFASVDNPEKTEGADEESGESSDDFDDARAIVGSFMDGLLYHNTDVLVQYGGARSYNAYSFLDGVCLTDWEIVDAVLYDENTDSSDRQGFSDSGKTYSFRVKMNISESSSEIFPVGESIWRIDVSDHDDSYFSAFVREGAEERGVLTGSVAEIDASKAVKMCYAFTSEFDWLFGGEEMSIDIDHAEKQIERERAVDNLLSYCLYFNSMDGITEDGVSFSAEWFENSINKLLGMSGIELSEFSCYNAESNTVSVDSVKYSCGYALLEDEIYDEENGNYSVTLDWYADTIFLAKAFTITYTLSDNDDDTIRLVSAEKIYDSGNPPAFFTEGDSGR